MYLEIGYNCVTYDLRGHGENRPSLCTYGYREGLDLAGITNYFIHHYNPERCFETTGGKKHLKLIPGTKHATGILEHEGEYKEAVTGFLKELNLL